ncbi:hypothetical protein [Coprobacter sp.]
MKLRKFYKSDRRRVGEVIPLGVTIRNMPLGIIFVRIRYRIGGYTR